MIVLVSLLTLVCLIMLIVGVINPKWALPWVKEEKKKRKNVILYYGLGFILCVVLGVNISEDNKIETSNDKEIVSTDSSNKKESVDSKSSDTESTTKKEESKNTTAPKTYVGIFNVTTQNVTSGDGSKILGKRGQAYFTKEDMTKESLTAFYNEVVKNSGYNYYTLINSKDKTKGIVFTGCLTPASYGDIDSTGGITKSSSSFDVSEYAANLIK